MSMFSKTCEYGIKAVVYIAQKSIDSEKIGLKSIAEAIDSPEPFTAKILQQLVRADIVSSQKGPFGGFYLDKNAAKSLNLAQIVTALDGDSIFRGCALGLSSCDESNPCPVHSSFKKIRDSLHDMLLQTKVVGLALGLEEGITVLKR